MAADWQPRGPCPRPALPRGPFLIAGLGRAGQSATRALTAVVPGDQIWVNDDMLTPQREADISAAIERLGVRRLRTGNGPLPRELDPFPATLVKSPGIRPDAALISSAAALGLEVIDEAELGWRLDSRPQIAVTGTNGKSTTAALVAAALTEAGISSALAGNMEFGPALTGAPGEPGEVVVAELSSFQLECCPELLPEAAVFTNLTADHIYRHGDLETYGACKRRLFIRGDRAVPFAAVGVDQAFGRTLADEVEKLGGKVVRFGRGERAERRVLDCESSLDGSVVTLSEQTGTRTVTTRLAGPHNALNVAGAFALSDALGLDPQATAMAIEQVAPLPGRFERIVGGNGLEALVDFAHNAAGVATALGTARAVLDARATGSLIVVLSALGFVGQQQASAMGRAARERSDALFLTSQRWTASEPFDQVAPGLEAGARSVENGTLVVEYDRREAIRRALDAASPGDIVMVLERGARGGVLFDHDDVARPFDDREVVRELLAAQSD